MEDFDLDVFLETMNGEEESCPMPECSARFKGRRAARRHWTATHRPNIIVYLCLIINCIFHNPRADRVRHQFSKNHPDATSSQEHLHRITKFLPYQEEPNKRFISLGITSPPFDLSSTIPKFNPSHRYPDHVSPTPSSTLYDSSSCITQRKREELIKDLEQARKEMI